VLLIRLKTESNFFCFQHHLPQATTMQGTLKALCVLVCFLALVNADCPHQRSDLTRWSSWSGKPSGDMQNVTIPSDTKILLDESTPIMHFLHIFGELIFDDKALTVDAHFIYVRKGGHMWIGTNKHVIILSPNSVDIKRFR
jgi:hypothetical protein